MRTVAIAVTPYGLASRRDESRRELIEILSTAQFWRLRMVECTALSLIVFFLFFAIAARL